MFRIKKYISLELFKVKLLTLNSSYSRIARENVIKGKIYKIMEEIWNL